MTKLLTDLNIDDSLIKSSSLKTNAQDVVGGINENHTSINTIKTKISNIIYNEITYEELKTLRDDGKLSIGSWYYITDYMPSVSVSNLQVSVINMFHILIQAITLKSFDNHVIIPEHPEWKVEYYLDYDIIAYPELGKWYNGTKGIITYMMDENHNEAYFDFYSILVNANYINGSTAGSNFIHAIITKNSFYNKIGKMLDMSFSYNYIERGSTANVIKFNSTMNYIGENSAYNIIGNYANYNYIKSDSYGNVVGNNSEYNIFAVGSFYNTIGYLSIYNEFKTNCLNNIIGNNSNYNIFNGNNSSIILGDNTSDNTFSDNVKLVTFLDGASDNSIGENSSYIHFGFNSSNIILGENNFYIHIGDNNSTIVLPNNNYYITTGDKCTNIMTNAYQQHLTFGNLITTCDLTNVTLGPLTPTKIFFVGSFTNLYAKWFDENLLTYQIKKL